MFDSLPLHICELECGPYLVILFAGNGRVMCLRAAIIAFTLDLNYFLQCSCAFFTGLALLQRFSRGMFLLQVYGGLSLVLFLIVVWPGVHGNGSAAAAA